MPLDSPPDLDLQRLKSTLAPLLGGRDADAKAAVDRAASRIVEVHQKEGITAAAVQAYRIGWRAGERSGQHTAASHIAQSAALGVRIVGPNTAAGLWLAELAGHAASWARQAGSPPIHPTSSTQVPEVSVDGLVGKVARSLSSRNLYGVMNSAVRSGRSAGHNAAALDTFANVRERALATAASRGTDLDRTRIAGLTARDWLADPSLRGQRLSAAVNLGPQGAHRAARPQPRPGSTTAPSRSPVQGSARAPALDRHRPRL